MIILTEAKRTLDEPQCQSCLRSRSRGLGMGQLLAYSEVRITPERGSMTTVITLCESCLRQLRNSVNRELVRIRGRPIIEEG